jgi:hypothetical protein
MKTMIRCFLLVLLLLTIGLSGGGAAIAQEGTNPTPAATEDPNLLSFAFYPKDKQPGQFFDPTIEAGEREELTVLIGNSGNVPFEARTYAIDAGTAPNGGFRAADYGTPPSGVTTWLDYPEETFTIEVGRGVERTFTISVPEDTEPGQYLTAIAVETAEARPVEGTEMLTQVIRQVLPVFITVPGDVEPAFEIGNITLTNEASGSALTLEIINSGNVRVRPEGTVTVADASGATIVTAPVAMDSVYARDQTTLSIGFPAVQPGEYRVSAELQDPETGVTASVSDVAVTAQEPATPIPPDPVGFAEVSATPLPSLDEIQFLGISLVIYNDTEPLTNARVTLRASRDGEPVEEFALASSLSLPTGTTAVEARYIPLTGWESGTWSFELVIETVDPATNVTQVLATGELPDIEVP